MSPHSKGINFLSPAQEKRPREKKRQAGQEKNALPSDAMDRERILTARSIDAMIAEGQAVLIFEDYVLRLDSWLAKHPGGRLPILHMVGKDATDEITV